MAACTSCAAESMLRFRSNWITTCEAPTVLWEVSWVIPGICESWRSSGVATETAIVSALAPAMLAVTWIVGKSICGSDATGRNGNAAMPTNATAAISSMWRPAGE